MSAQLPERQPIPSSELVPFTELESLSRGVYILSNELNLLCGFAKGDQKELSSAAVKHIQNYVNCCFEPFADVSARFAIAAQDMGNKVIWVGAWSGTSAHDVTLKSAERICDLLWSHLDCDGYYSQFRSPPPELRFDFCPDLVKEQWAKSKAVILGSDGLSDKWWANFQGIPVLIKNEWVRLKLSEQVSPADGADGGKSAQDTKGKHKRSTEKGEARVKIIAGLMTHHQYEKDGDGSCGKFDPIGVRELARTVKGSEGAVSKFFKDDFGGHVKYRAACCDNTRLINSLRILNGDLTPSLLSPELSEAAPDPDAVDPAHDEFLE